MANSELRGHGYGREKVRRAALQSLPFPMMYKGKVPCASHLCTAFPIRFWAVILNT